MWRQVYIIAEEREGGMLKVGDLIDGKYKILNEIGRGGMSTVYLAINEKANNHGQ